MPPFRKEKSNTDPVDYFSLEEYYLCAKLFKYRRVAFRNDVVMDATQQDEDDENIE